MSEENKNSDNRFLGIVGTVTFHLLALLLILFFALSTPLPLPGEEGVEVNLGSSDYGMGNVQERTPPPREETPPPPPPQTSDPKTEQDEEVITQDSEEAPAIEEVQEDVVPEKPKPVIEDIEEFDPELEDDIIPDEIIEDPEPAETYNPRSIYPGNANTDGDGSNEGITGQPGDQGQENGSPDATNYDGNGGLGDEGVGFDLGGRGAKHLPKPVYNSEEQGKVVVDIRVNREGKVVSAIAGARGTTISDLSLRRLAEEAALRSVFASDPNAPEVQTGTITYNFIRLN